MSQTLGTRNPKILDLHELLLVRHLPLQEQCGEFPSSSFFSVALINTSQKWRGRKGSSAYSPSAMEGSPGRKQEPPGNTAYWLAQLPFYEAQPHQTRVCSTHSGLGPPTSTSKQADVSTGQSDAATSSIEISSSQVCLGLRQADKNKTTSTCASLHTLVVLRVRLNCQAVRTLPFTLCATCSSPGEERLLSCLVTVCG